MRSLNFVFWPLVVVPLKVAARVNQHRDFHLLICAWYWRVIVTVGAETVNGEQGGVEIFEFVGCDHDGNITMTALERTLAIYFSAIR